MQASAGDHPLLPCNLLSGGNGGHRRSETSLRASLASQRGRQRAGLPLGGQGEHGTGHVSSEEDISWASELGALGVQRGGRETEAGWRRQRGWGRREEGDGGQGGWHCGKECGVQGQETRVQAAALPPTSCATLTSDLTSLSLGLLRRRGQAGAAGLARHPFSEDGSLRAPVAV